MAQQQNSSLNDIGHVIVQETGEARAKWWDQGDQLVDASRALTRLSALTLLLAVMHSMVAVQVSLLALAITLVWDRRAILPGFSPSGSQAASRRQPLAPRRPRGADLARARRLIETHQAGEAHLVALGDKELLWSRDGDAFLMFARRGRSLVALFDPVGPESRWPELLAAFRATAARQSCQSAFYQASDRFCRFAAENGMTGYKLGELAAIDLSAFTMAGKDWASLRRAVNRAERDGLEFSLLAEGEAKPLIDALQAVSDDWLRLNKAGEKGFSLGAFDRAYLQAFPLAVVRLEGRVVAFANLLVANGNVFVDLMRFRPGVHRGVMDFLMVRLIERLKADGFATLNLGMAPLSNLADDGTAWNRIGRLVFNHANSLYNFRGLLAFKTKFAPDWQPRYLVVEAGTRPYRAAAAAALLISGGFRKMFRA